MLDPALIEVFVREYHAEYARKADTSRRDEAKLQRRVPALRNLIDRIVVTPNPRGRGVLLDVEGRLAAILDLASGNAGSGKRLFVMERVKGIEPSS